MINKEFWKGKKVFLTGHTGFKGSWMSLWLNELGAEVHGYSLAPITEPSLFELSKVATRIHSVFGDIRDFAKLQKTIKECNPDVVIHLAAQPLVRKSYRDPIETYSTNVMGTVNILEAARSCSNLKCIVNVTTDKVYENKELDIPFKEEDRLGGFDPYSNSKACSELVTSSYRSAFLNSTGVKVVTARAGNVIGGGDWSEDRLIPDIIRALEKKEKVIIRSPRAIRPWQHVLESLAGYLELTEYLYSSPDYYIESWNFGPGTSDFMTVGEIVNFIKSDMPHLGLNFEVQTADLHEAQILKLDNSLAQKNLNWSSHWPAKTAIRKTFEWYEQHLNGVDTFELTRSQIKEFCQ
ncbi:MAG: CDP-glucose 4,6-dehydratase [Bacteriovoracaceae bacterium]|nr:CDP-glucose 4,6-dehydratase [Bacteriovoracaceae bacterium]